jgi:hypothetical protein
MGKPDALSRRQDYSEGSKASEAPPITFLKPHQYDFSAKETSTISAITLRPVQGPSIDDTQTDILSRIQALQPQDATLSWKIPLLQDINLPRTPEQSQELQGYSLHPATSIVLFNNHIYVPENHHLKLDILEQVHNTQLSGHLGNEKTYRLLARTYYFPRMRFFTNTYVQGCETCKRNKTPRHQPYGLLQPLPIPEAPWQSVSMDSIVKLPKSKGFDSILVIVDRFTKMAHFIPYKEQGFMVYQRTSSRIVDQSSTPNSGENSPLDLESNATSLLHSTVRQTDKLNV